ncbi:MAG TPA: putative maltokinase [Candidatus Acidoferrum sp.]|nr:putative maltokinase [Candidatus Acidoferrum sp.]
MDRLREAFAAQLPAYLQRQRWFGGKARQILAVSLADCVAIRMASSTALLTLASVVYSENKGETYFLPLLMNPNVSGAENSLSSVIRIPNPNASTEILLFDALGNKEFLALLLDSARSNVSYLGGTGEFEAKASPALREQYPSSAVAPQTRVIKAEQSNTSIVYGERLILKLFRRVAEGTNPDLEIGRFLTQVAHFPYTPPFCGSLEYRTRDGKCFSLGILQGFVSNRGDAWSSTTQFLTELLVRSASSKREDIGRSENQSRANTKNSSSKALGGELLEQVELMGLLGKRTAELHLALASSRSDQAFNPEPFTAEFRHKLEAALHDMTVGNFDLLRSKSGELLESLRDSIARTLLLEDDVLLAFHSDLEKDISALRIRIHGDYHLGQVLFTGSDFLIIDFEGEPAKSISERRMKRSPLQDVAGMLRSFQYAAHLALMAAQDKLGTLETAGPELLRLAKQWQLLAASRFLESYKNTASGASFIPRDASEFDRLLRLHLLEKAIYELGYELNNRPAWLAIPLEGIEELLNKGGPGFDPKRAGN